MDREALSVESQTVVLEPDRERLGEPAGAAGDPLPRCVGVETALAAVTRDDAGLISECADLLFHLLVLLGAEDLPLDEVEHELAARHRGA